MKDREYLYYIDRLFIGNTQYDVVVEKIINDIYKTLDIQYYNDINIFDKVKYILYVKNFQDKYAYILNYKDIDVFACGEIDSILYTYGYSSYYNQLKKDFVMNMYFVKIINNYINKSEEGDDSWDIDKLYALINSYKFKNTNIGSYLLYIILKSLQGIFEEEYTCNMLSEIKKILFNPVFRNTKISFSVLNTIYTYAKLGYFEVSEIYNTLSICNFSTYLGLKEVDNKLEKIIFKDFCDKTVGELIDELIKRKNNGKHHLKNT